MTHALIRAARFPADHRMPHKFDPAHMAELDREDRREWQSPRILLDLARVRPGMATADVGCGIGYFAIPAAKRVGSKGMVFAIDTEADMLRELRRRLRAGKIANVRPVQSAEQEIPLPDACADVAWSVNTFHEFEDSVALLREVRRLLRPGGSVLLVDWKPIDTPMGPPLEVRVSAREISRALRAAGFTGVSERRVYAYHTVVVGRRPL